jgi:hypothetical protein
MVWLLGLTMHLSVGPAAGEEVAQAPAEKQAVAVKIAGGAFTLQAPAHWVRKQPTSNIVEHEFALPRAEGDQADGRLTVMAAGGSVEQNIDRWVGQFKAPAGGEIAKKAEKKNIGGQEVHLVDLQGTYLDRKGPFAPATEQEAYRMLGAIIVTQGKGQHFIKLYGPVKTIAQEEKSFRAFIDSLSGQE